MLEDILKNNQQFLQRKEFSAIGHLPQKHTAIVTCMDCRLVEMLEPALGIHRGDVVELRTAGATVSTTDREKGTNDLIRSLAGSIYLLGVDKIFVIGHTGCGLNNVNAEKLAGSIRAHGVDPDAIIQHEGLIDTTGLARWIGAFDDLHINVHQVVSFIRHHPYLPHTIPVYGLIIHIEDGRLELVDKPYEAALG